RLTEHLNNILLRDSTNFQLGLYLTSNMNEISNSFVLNDGILDGIPVGTALSQKGTVLYGSNENVSEDKRVQLEIYYTKHDDNIIEISNYYFLKDSILDGNPVGTALSQKGTVLYGSNENVPEDKRVQLEIYYTEPDN